MPYEPNQEVAGRTLLAIVRRDTRGRSFWNVLCGRCGQQHVFRTDHIANTSCDVHGRYAVRAKRPSKHGLSKTPTYVAWSGMMHRCANPANPRFSHYGGRGIRVCERWHDFMNFLEDMGPKPPGLSIDRINNDGNYEPGNCRWATAQQQSANRRPFKRKVKS